VKGDFREALLYGISAGLEIKRQLSVQVAHASPIATRPRSDRIRITSRPVSLFGLVISAKAQLQGLARAWAAGARREYVPVGSTAPSLAPRAPVNPYPSPHQLSLDANHLRF